MSISYDVNLFYRERKYNIILNETQLNELQEALSLIEEYGDKACVIYELNRGKTTDLIRLDKVEHISIAEMTND